MIIAIDGPAGTGKSTIAKRVAHMLGFAHFDTGAMYRAFTWWLIHNKIADSDEEGIRAALGTFDLHIENQGGQKTYKVGTEDVTAAIRSSEITERVSSVAAIGFVRSELVKIQKDFGAHNDAVFEGRDMGSVVFPHAELKVYLTARPQIRGERRLAQILEKDPQTTATLEEITRDIEARDHADSSRKNSPLVQASDAKLVDTSDLTIDEVVKAVIDLWNDHMPEEKPSLFYSACRAIVYAWLKVCYRHRITGEQHIPKGAAIFAANHVSFLDPPIIGCSSKAPIHFFARASLFNGWLLHFFISRLNTHPLHYGDHELGAMKMACQLLESGKKIILFPEGERSFNGELRPLKPGVSRISLRTAAPIVPVYLDGVFSIWPRTRSLPKFFGRTQCHFGEPINPKDYAHLSKKEAAEKLNEDLEKAIIALAAKA